MKCEGGLGWPSTVVEDPVSGLDQLEPETYVSREKLLVELEEFRTFTYGDRWKPGKAGFTLAMLVVKGLLRRKK